MYDHAKLSNCLNLDSMAQFYTLQESFSKLVFFFFYDLKQLHNFDGLSFCWPNTLSLQITCWMKFIFLEPVTQIYLV